MDPVEALLALYLRTQTPAERHVLLEAVRITNPADFGQFEERMLQQLVRGLTHDRLIQTISIHRNISAGQAEERLRDLALQHLLDRSKLVANLASDVSAPPAEQKAHAETEPLAEVAILGADPHRQEPSPAQRPASALHGENSLPRLAPRGVAG